MTPPDTNARDFGTDYGAAIARHPQHQDLPANQVSAMAAIKAQAAYLGTTVDTATVLPSYVRVKFADGTWARVAFGYVHHSVAGIPGSELIDNGTWNTWLPVHGTSSSSAHSDVLATIECPNDPGIALPITTTECRIAVLSCDCAGCLQAALRAPTTAERRFGDLVLSQLEHVALRFLPW